jgi:hypothetical protein
MDVVDDGPLLLQGALNWLAFRRGFFELFTKFLVGVLKVVAMAAVIAADLTDDEAKGCGQDHPDGYESAGLSVMDLLLGRLFVENAVDGRTRDPVRLRNLAQAVAASPVPEDGLTIQIQRLAADMAASSMTGMPFQE